MDKKIGFKDLNRHLKIVVTFVTVEIILTTIAFGGIVFGIIAKLY